MERVNRDIWFIDPGNSKANINDLLTRLVKITDQKCHTRFICLVPETKFSHASVLTLAHIAKGSPIVTSLEGGRASSDMSLMLVANKASLLIDPINWVSLRDRLLINSGIHCISVPENTDARFRERTPFPHAARKGYPHLRKQALQKPCMYSFFDAWTPNDPTKARLSNVPGEIAKLIDKANKHPPFLSILGVLPNQLRTILKKTGLNDIDEIMDDLSYTLFREYPHLGQETEAQSRV